MPEFKELIRDYREAKGTLAADELKEQILAYRVQAFSEQDFSNVNFSEIENDQNQLIQILKYPEPDEEELFTEVYQNNSDIFGYKVQDIFKDTIFDRHPYIVNLFNIAGEKNAQFKIYFPYSLRDVPNWPEKMVSIHDLFSQKERDMIYSLNFNDEWGDKALLELFEKNHFVSQEMILTRQVYNELVKSELTVDQLKNYLQEGIDSKLIFDELCSRNMCELAEFLYKQDPKVYDQETLGRLLVMQPRPYEILDFLIEEKVDLNIPFSNISGLLLSNLTPLQVCIIQNDPRLINKLFSSNCDLNINYIVKQHYDSGARIINETALSCAIKDNRDIKLIEKLLSISGIDVTIPDNKPLKYAIEQGRVELTPMLLQKGARLTDQEFQELFLAACKDKNKAALSTLITINPKAILTDPQIYEAIQDVDILNALWDSFAKLENSDDFVLLCQKLVEKKEDEDFDAWWQRKSLMETIVTNRLSEVSEDALLGKVVQNSGLPLNLQPNKLLLDMIRSDNSTGFKKCLALGATLNFNQDEAIKLAVDCNTYGLTDVMILLLDLKDVDVSQKIFNHAIASLNLTVLRLGRFPDEDAYQFTLTQGQALLHKAILTEDSFAVEWLMTKGVSPNYNRSEPLSTAINMNPPNLQIVQALLDCEADPKARGYQLIFKAFNNYRATDIPEYFYVAQSLLQKLGIPDGDIRANMVGNSLDDYQTNVEQILKHNFTPAQVAAFDILRLHNDISQRVDNEYAGSDSLTKRTRLLFEKVVEPAFRKKFLEYGEDDMTRVMNIEKEIKLFILDTIIKNCESSQESASRALKDYIIQNKDKLIQGNDPEIMSKMRELAISDEDTAQIAWRAYDPGVACDPSWTKLLVPQTGTGTIYTTEASAAHALNEEEASNIIRTMVAYYFIADPKVNEMNFLAQIASMCRAHNGPKDGKPDSFSCFPGCVGRIGKMGEGHPTLQLPPLRLEIIDEAISATIVKHFAAQIEHLPQDEKRELCYALTMLSIKNAEEILAGQAQYDDSWLALRTKFRESLGAEKPIDEIVNEALEKADEPPLSPFDHLQVDVRVLDVGGGKNASQLYQRLNEKVVENVQKAITNPFSITPASIQIFKQLPQKRKRIESQLPKFIEFELLGSHCTQQLSNASPDSIKDFVKALVDETFASDKTGDEKVKEAFDQIIRKHQALLQLNDDELPEFKKALIGASSFSGLDDEKRAFVVGRVKEKLLTEKDHSFNNLLSLEFDKLIQTLPTPSKRRSQSLK